MTTIAMLLAASCLNAHGGQAQQAGARLSPAYRPTFFAHPDFAARPQLSPTPAPQTPAPPARPAEASLPGWAAIPGLSPSAIPAARENLSPAVEALMARKALSEPQHAAVGAIAKAAFQARDVDTLARLALLAAHRSQRGTRDMVLEALIVLRNRLGTSESVEARAALTTLYDNHPLPAENRDWMAGQVLQRARGYVEPQP